MNIKIRMESKLIIPKNLNKWFKDLSKADKEDIYKYWLNQNSYIYVEAPEFVDPIDYFKTSPLIGETTSGM